MAKYTLIASRDAFESTEAGRWLDLAGELNKAGNHVTLFLVQNGCLAARPSRLSTRLTTLAEAGVEILADRFSLSERGISQEKIARGVKASELDVVIDHLVEGRKVIWH